MLKAHKLLLVTYITSYKYVVNIFISTLIFKILQHILD